MTLLGSRCPASTPRCDSNHCESCFCTSEALNEGLLAHTCVHPLQFEEARRCRDRFNAVSGRPGHTERLAVGGLEQARATGTVKGRAGTPVQAACTSCQQTCTYSKMPRLEPRSHAHKELPLMCASTGHLPAHQGQGQGPVAGLQHQQTLQEPGCQHTGESRGTQKIEWVVISSLASQPLPTAARACAIPCNL